MIVYIIGILILLILFCFIFFFVKYTKLKDIKKSLDMCSENISNVLKNKEDLINDLLKDIKDNRIKDSFNYDDTASLIDKENTLFDTAFAVNKYIKNGKSKKLKEKVKTLNSLEEGLDGLKDYYNSNVVNYNEIYQKKFFNQLFKMLKFEPYKSFKIRKLEEYEIFKN